MTQDAEQGAEKPVFANLHTEECPHPHHFLIHRTSIYYIHHVLRGLTAEQTYQVPHQFLVRGRQSKKNTTSGDDK